MPIEIRKLVFTTAELQDVVVSHCLSGNIPLPDAPIEGIEVSNEPEATVTINFQAADPAHQTLFASPSNRWPPRSSATAAITASRCRARARNCYRPRARGWR